MDPVILVKRTFIQYTYVEEADHLRHKPKYQKIYGKRWTTLRGLKKLSMQAMLTFASMNLKKMANWTWVSPVTA